MIQNKDILSKLTEHIEKIENREGEEIKFSKLEFKIENRRHSSKESVILYIDNKALSNFEMKSYIIYYRCRCGRLNKTLLQKYKGKLKLWCQHCCQDSKFKDRYYANILDKEKKEKYLTKCIKIERPKDILECDKDFQNNYYKSHLTEEEFFDHLNDIYELNGIVLNNDIRKNIKFIYAYPISNNQFRFTSKISFDDGKTFETLKTIKLKCYICGKIFNIHLYNLRDKEINKPKCNKCSFSNKLFAIKKFNSEISYQSNLEKQFIEFCLNNDIKILNGFKISYNFQNKDRTYITDFFLPELKRVIELKGSNHFYRKDLKEGKIEAKNNAANNFCKEHGFQFDFVLDVDLDKYLEKLLTERDSLNFSES